VRSAAQTAEAGVERVGRLKEKYARVACEYDIQVEKAALEITSNPGGTRKMAMKT